MKNIHQPWEFVRRAGRSAVSFDAEQLRVLAHRGNPMLVLGGPGTGKTTVLAEYASRCQDLDEPVLVFARNRQRASALRNAIAQRGNSGVSSPDVMTFHGFAWALARRYWPKDSTPRLLTAPEQDVRLRQLLVELGESLWPVEYRGAVGTNDFVKQLRTTVARLRQFNADPQEIADLNGSPLWQSLAQFFTGYVERLRAAGEVDYGELAFRCQELLDAEDLDLRGHYGAILVDDFADSEPGQVAWLQSLSSGGTTLVAFADPQQALNTFRGTDSSVVRDFAELFPGGETICLNRNYRQAEPLAAISQAIAGRIIPPGLVGESARYWQTIPQIDGEKASVQAWSFAATEDQARALASAIRADHLVRGIDWAEIAVVFPRRSPAVNQLLSLLVAQRVPVAIAGEEIPLAAEPAVRPLLLGLSMALASTEAGLTELALSPIGGFDQLQWRKVLRSLRGSNLTLADYLAEPFEATGPVRKLSALLDLLRQVRAMMDDSKPVDWALNTLWQAQAWPKDLQAQALSGGREAAFAHRQLDSVCALFALAAREEWGRGRDGAQRFLDEIMAQQIPADNVRESRFELPGVQFSTVYNSTGRQWRSVYVIGLVEGQWPNEKAATSLFEIDRLTRDGWGLPATSAEVVAAERRLLYTAVSRASERLVLCGLANGEDYEVSRFLAHLGLSVETPVFPDDWANGAEMCVRFRRILDDESERPAIRQLAANELRRLSEVTSADGTPLFPGAHPQNWWGVAEVSSNDPVQSSGLKLTGSRVEKLLLCPRQYFLTQLVEADSTRSPALFVGSLVHAVCEQASIPSDMNWAQFLADNWPWAAFDSRYQGELELARAQACVRRYLVWHRARTQVGFASSDRETPADYVFYEQKLALEGEYAGHPVWLEGKVDRLEVVAGRVHVYDLKTSRNKLSPVGSIATHPQLGFYQYLIRQGAATELLFKSGVNPEKVDPSDPGGGELVFVSIADLKRTKTARELKPGEEYPAIMVQESIVDRPNYPGEDVSVTEDDQNPQMPWIDDLINKALGILVAGEFPATPSEDACTYCPVQSSCPAVDYGKQVW